MVRSRVCQTSQLVLIRCPFGANNHWLVRPQFNEISEVLGMSLASRNIRLLTTSGTQRAFYGNHPWFDKQLEHCELSLCVDPLFSKVRAHITRIHVLFPQEDCHELAHRSGKDVRDGTIIMVLTPVARDLFERLPNL